LIIHFLDFFNGFFKFAARHHLAAVTSQAAYSNIRSNAVNNPSTAAAGMLLSQDNNVANLYFDHDTAFRLRFNPIRISYNGYSGILAGANVFYLPPLS
jgi:hypothetical protein